MFAAAEETTTTETTPEEGYSFLEIFIYSALVSMILYLLKQIFFPAPEPPRPVYVPKPKPEPRAFTKEELLLFNGTNDKPIYIGVKGKIYDVSSRSEFYGPGGPYHLFAGHDASRALALGSLDEKDIDGPIEGLEYSELEALEEWIGSYEMKYDVVGWYPFEDPTKKAEAEKAEGSPSAEGDKLASVD